MQNKLTKIQWRAYAFALALGSACFAAASEKIVVIQGLDMEPVNKMLRDGWTVKHQSSTVQPDGIDARYNLKAVTVFTLTSPSPEEVAEAEARKKAEFERRRAEYLAKKNEAEKP